MENTKSSTNPPTEEVSEEQVRDSLLVEQADPYDELLEDPEIRTRVKEELKNLATRGYYGQPQQQAPQQPQVNPLDEVNRKIQENDQWIDEFFSKPDDKRNFEEFERRKVEQSRLDRKRNEIMLAQQQQREALGRSQDVVEGFIKRVAEVQKKRFGESRIQHYADEVRRLASQLDPAILADEGRLRQNLEWMIEPVAFKRYEESRFNQRSRAQKQRYEARGEAYMDDQEDTPEQNDPYADASPEERRFLRGLGLIKDGKDNKEALIPTENGYIIPIRKGRRNG